MWNADNRFQDGLPALPYINIIYFVCMLILDFLSLLWIIVILEGYSNNLIVVRYSADRCYLFYS